MRPLDDILAYCKAATKGPWVSRWTSMQPSELDEETLIEATACEGVKRNVVATDYYDGLHLACSEEDSTFIAQARTDLPALAEEVILLRQMIPYMQHRSGCASLPPRKRLALGLEEVRTATPVECTCGLTKLLEQRQQLLDKDGA